MKKQKPNGYIKKSIYSGMMLEIVKTVKIDRPTVRGAKRKRSPEEIAGHNRREREKRLTRLIALNFTKNDYFLTLTFKEEPERDKLSGILAKFFRRLRKTATVRYILIDEKGERGGRLHLHMLLNQEVSYADIASAWEWGQVRSSAVYSEKDFRGLAKYLLKNRRADGEKAWRCSRNLKKPVENVKKVSAKTFRAIPSAEIKVKGNSYRLEAVEEHFDPFTMENVQYALYFRKDVSLQNGKSGRKGYA